MSNKYLEALYDHVHPMVRALKMGEAGIIPCTREFTADEIQSYLWGYAMHKNKWFSTTRDPVINVIHVVRVAVPKLAARGADPEEIQ